MTPSPGVAINGSGDILGTRSETESSDEVFDCMIAKSYQVHQEEALALAEELQEPGEDLDDVKGKVRTRLLPKYRKSLKNIYLQELLKMDALRQHPIHKSIMRTVNKLVDDGGIDRDEAFRQSLSRRKHLIYRLIPDVEEEEDEDEEEAGSDA